MIPLRQDSNTLILEWLRRSRKSRQVKISLLTGAKALIGLATVEKWATDSRDHYQTEQYYLRDNGFWLFLDSVYNESKSPPKATPVLAHEPEATASDNDT